METLNTQEKNTAPFGLRLTFAKGTDSSLLSRKGFFIYEPTGKQLQLSGRETEILVLLKKGETVTEEAFMDFLYHDDDEDIPLGNGLAVTIQKLRDKLEEATNGELEIGNIRSLGYQLVKINKDAHEKE